MGIFKGIFGVIFEEYLEKYFLFFKRNLWEFLWNSFAFIEIFLIFNEIFGHLVGLMEFLRGFFGNCFVVFKGIFRDFKWNFWRFFGEFFWVFNGIFLGF